MHIHIRSCFLVCNKKCFTCLYGHDSHWVHWHWGHWAIRCCDVHAWGKCKTNTGNSKVFIMHILHRIDEVWYSKIGNIWRSHIQISWSQRFWFSFKGWYFNNFAVYCTSPPIYMHGCHWCLSLKLTDKSRTSAVHLMVLNGKRLK